MEGALVRICEYDDLNVLEYWDQPTTVPVQKTEKDADLDAVRRLFELLLKFTQEDVPGFQLIVTEHANLRDQWFQDALVEEPWTKPPALVPEEWPPEAAN